MQKVSIVGLVGLGTVGIGWAATYLAKGLHVKAYDPSPQASEFVRNELKRIWPSLIALKQTELKDCPLHRLTITSKIASSVEGVSIVHENGPERLETKRQIYSEIESSVAEDAIIASSSGGLQPTALQLGMRHPERFLIVHPFNPPHLVPLVEILGGQGTDVNTIEAMFEFMTSLGKHPIRLRKEATAYLTNRLQFALLREAIHCLVEGIADANAIEDAVRFGLAPRWLAAGSLTTLTLAGGQGGMKRVLESFAPAIDSWWSSLGSTQMTDETKSKLARASVEILAGQSVSEWISLRDERLIGALRALSDMENGHGHK